MSVTVDRPSGYLRTNSASAREPSGRVGPAGRRKTVLVASAGSESGQAAIASLREAGFLIHGADFQAVRPSLLPRHLASYSVVAARTQSEFLHSVRALVDRLAPDAFLPVGTRFALAASREAANFLPRTVTCAPPYGAFLQAYSKSRCAAACAELAIPTPRLFGPDEALACAAADPNAVFVVKPDFDLGAATGVVYARGLPELRAAIAACHANFGRPLVQEFVPGDAEAMKTVLLLFAPEGRLVSAFTTRKVHQWPISGGVTAIGESTSDWPLVQQMLPLFGRWRWKGPAEVELKLDHRDGRHKVIEINPRFPGYLHFAGDCGLPLPAMAVRLALGEPVTAAAYPAYRVGARYLNLSQFAKAVASGVAQRDWPELLRSAASLSGTGRSASRLLRDPASALARWLGPPGRPAPVFDLEG